MKKIEIIKVYVDGDTIHYQVKEDKGLGILKQESVNVFIKHHNGERFELDFSQVPLSILYIPITLYLLPITYFFNIELVIPEIDSVLYKHLPDIYNAYSKIYGPFHLDWRGKITIGKIVENTTTKNSQYDKIVFFSGGVDACHAAINNAGRKSILVSIPDIERDSRNDGPLRNEKFSLIQNFSKIVDSDWLLISNNFNDELLNDKEIYHCLSLVRKLDSVAYNYDGWGGIRYLANMCCIATFAYVTGIRSLIMGSSFEPIEDKISHNDDGASPELSNTIKFINISFAEQDGFMTRRSQKVEEIINWCKSRGIRIKLWTCFRNGLTQCGYCGKCVRTQLNILRAGENPKDWGFDNFSPKKFSRYIKSFRYIENNPCWLWDNIDAIDANKNYPYCNEMLHWLKSIGYKEYRIQSEKCERRRLFYRRLTSLHQYPRYLRVIITRLIRK